MPSAAVLLGMDLQPFTTAFQALHGIVLPANDHPSFSMALRMATALARRGLWALVSVDLRHAPAGIVPALLQQASALDVWALVSCNPAALLRCGDVKTGLEHLVDLYRATPVRNPQSRHAVTASDLRSLVTRAVLRPSGCWSGGLCGRSATPTPKVAPLLQPLIVQFGLDRHPVVFLEPRASYSYVFGPRQVEEFAVRMAEVLPGRTPSIPVPSEPESTVLPQASLVDRPAYRVNADSGRLTDHLGREVYFHGVNVVVKGPPWVPETDTFHPTLSFSEEDARILQSLGMNVIRLGVMWPGIEPREGWYDPDYLERVKKVIRIAAAHGLHTLVDMHQDVLSEKFCGEGLPLWAVPTNPAFPLPLGLPFSTDPSGVPSEEECLSHPWASYQGTQAVVNAFHGLYTNVHGLRDRWAAAWRHVALALRHHGAAVLGYDLLNEPFIGNALGNPTLLLPCASSQQLLQAAYDAVAASIREVDSEHCLFFEPVPTDIGCKAFQTVPGGDAWRSRSVLSYHYYEPPQRNMTAYAGFVLDNARSLGCGTMLTEFSLTDVPLETTLCVMQHADQYLQSWIGWSFKVYGWDKTGANKLLWDDGGAFQEDRARLVSRTYAQIVAGLALAMSFDVPTAAFFLRYVIVDGVHSTESVVYLSPTYHYPTGYVLRCTPAGIAWRHQGANTIVLDHGQLRAGTVVECHITRYCQKALPPFC
eukprot:GGOE01050532.1.p1 GENE.GGOE01050532.1~~GGOE01050532.1.p1  ORF type:complete len:704 (-),score=146.21 GGOE01050532.1:434-2545(-)